MSSAPPRGATWYQVLGVEPGASADAIRLARRRLQKTHHPDHGGDGERSRLINVAHDVLIDPASRKAYDDHLRAARTQARPAPAAHPTRDGAGSPPTPSAPARPDTQGPWLLDLTPRLSRYWTVVVNALAALVLLVSATVVIARSDAALWPLPPALSGPALLVTCAAFAWSGSLLQDSRRPTGATMLAVAAALSAVLAAIGTVLAGT